MSEQKKAWSKVLSLVLAVVFMLHGCSLLTVGVLVEVTVDQYRPIGTFSSTTAGLIITISLFMLAVGTAGMKGLYTEHRVLLNWFCLTASLLIVLEFIGGILCFVYAEKVAMQFGDKLAMNVSTYRWGDSLVVSDCVDDIQSEFKCCGSINFLEWETNPGYECNRTELFCSLPVSCCEKNASLCGYLRVDVATTSGTSGENVSLQPFPDIHRQPEYRGFVYSKGCQLSFSQWVLKTVDFVGVLSLFMVSFKVICSLALGWYVQNTEDVSRMYTI